MIRMFALLKQNKYTVLLGLIFAAFIFLRSYHFLERANFGWDQVDGAWGVKQILIDHNFFLNGPVAKGNSGIYMGPLYYYAASPFYFLTDLDPIASPIFQLLLTIINFFVIYFITKRLFGEKVAVFACFINTFSTAIMSADRIQSAFYLIPAISYILFYFLYKVITDNPKAIVPLALLLSISFHVDFTSVFYPIIIVLTLPFFPKKKVTFLYSFIAILIVLFFISPILINSFLKNPHQAGSYITLFNTTFHGFHLTRFFQLFHDAFISFEEILQFRFFRNFVFLVPLLFAVIYFTKNFGKNSLRLFYLIILWISIPWIVLATYSGELTDYYFSFPKDLAIAMLAFLSVWMWQQKYFVIKLLPVVFWIAYSLQSIAYCLAIPNGDLLANERAVKTVIHNKKTVPFKDHDAQTYMYYVYGEIQSKTKK